MGLPPSHHHPVSHLAHLALVSQIKVHPSSCSPILRGLDRHGPPKEGKHWWSWVWSPGSPGGAECFPCHLFGAPPLPHCVSAGTVGQLEGFLGAGEAQVCDALAPALACEEKLPPSAWRGWYVKWLGRSCTLAFPDPLPEGWRLPAL